MFYITLRCNTDCTSFACGITVSNMSSLQCAKQLQVNMDNKQYFAILAFERIRQREAFQKILSKRNVDTNSDTCNCFMD